MSLCNASKYWKIRLSSIPSLLWFFILYTSIRRMIWQITYTINLFYSKLFNHLLTFRLTLSHVKNSSIFLSTTLFFMENVKLLKVDEYHDLHNILQFYLFIYMNSSSLLDLIAFILWPLSISTSDLNFLKAQSTSIFIFFL